jgi:hypothetical protein
MNVTLAYRGHSAVVESPAAGGWQALRLVPNLARDPVGFDGQLRHPLRFREAMSALHDTVISDLRFKKKDKTAYLKWKKGQAQRKAVVRQEVIKRVVAEAIARREAQGVPQDLEAQYERSRKRYWSARQEYSNYLLKHDWDLWRKLMPCDPVITVADDVVFFECFSADESSYGCLTVDRGDGFSGAENAQYGTTNVDYSWDLYHHFQSLRSYRQTRLNVDPQGFTVATSGDAGEYREEKIDLPQSWLRGFMQLQSAMGMPMQRVLLSREAVYSILAWHKRHRAYKSPRAIRFELVNGRPPRVVLEPWEQAVTSHGTAYEGADVAAIRVWGGRRLTVLNRLLPLAERFDVYLLGTGLPSFWVARMGEMRLTLGLSGWTANDWTKGSALDLIAPPAAPSPDMVNNVCAFVREKRSVTLNEVQERWKIDAATALAALRQLAHSGQVIHDLVAGVYRWRQVMPKALGEAEIGPEHEELRGARVIMERGQAELTGRDEAPGGGYVLTGRIASNNVEILVDADQRIKRGKCICGWYHRYGMRNGPCRHMLALRWRSYAGAFEAYRKSGWYERLAGRG